ncbi:hypothetical protein P7K49_026094 [Saguinus oedipus]|uniref:Uncharacterized protein n=1 Tax=Saguinus oedipus TaxID=9490 RepID=A0ABQ9UJW5_SAGOE|nr:hypothetical protein P7K49_026094 [Saguinus oedipus]
MVSVGLTLCLLGGPGKRLEDLVFWGFRRWALGFCIPERSERLPSDNIHLNGQHRAPYPARMLPPPEYCWPEGQGGLIIDTQRRLVNGDQSLDSERNMGPDVAKVVKGGEFQGKKYPVLRRLPYLGI